MWDIKTDIQTFSGVDLKAGDEVQLNLICIWRGGSLSRIGVADRYSLWLVFAYAETSTIPPILVMPVSGRAFSYQSLDKHHTLSLSRVRT